MDTPSILLPMLSLLPFAVVGSFTPGPNNILVMSYGISHGLRATLPYQAGAGLACLLIITGAVLAGAQLEKLLPPFMVGIKYIGCAYMLWLAWVVARSPAPQPQNSTGDTAIPPKATPFGSSAVTYRSGFILQFINPKFYLYTITLTAVLAPAVRSPFDIGVIGMFFAAIAVAGMFAWASAGALLQHFLRRWHRASSIAMALALVWCAVTLL